MAGIDVMGRTSQIAWGPQMRLLGALGRVHRAHSHTRTFPTCTRSVSCGGVTEVKKTPRALEVKKRQRALYSQVLVGGDERLERRTGRETVFDKNCGA